MAARQWTEEQRQAQAEKIRQHKIWLKSTGPTSEQGKKIISQNALKTGEYTAYKVEVRKYYAAKKREPDNLYTYGDKRYSFNRSFKYSGLGFIRTLKKADREKIRNRLKTAATAT